MKPLKWLSLLTVLFAANTLAEGSQVTQILQHNEVVAVYLNPDPGKANCDVGSPYILKVDGTEANRQRFNMVLTAMSTGSRLSFSAPGCSSAIWGHSRPQIGVTFMTAP